MNLWKSVDLNETIKTYEYTRYTKYQIYTEIESEDFKNMDSKAIFHFISDKMEIIPFNEYLKRFIYQKSRMLEDIKKIPDKVFLDILVNSFMENAAPYSFQPTKIKMRPALRNLLKVQSIKRDTVFNLGFGLKMNETEVEEFLTKVNKEESFDFGNPEETIYWFCYHNGYRYSKARELMEYYDNLEITEHENETLWSAMKHDPKMYVHSEQELKVYLKYLKTFLDREDPAYGEFMKLYDQVRKVILESYQDSSLIDGKEEVYGLDDINPSVIERILYTEVPVVGKNLEKMSASILCRQFMNKRMSRQYISSILRKKTNPDRFDLITLLFFIYAQNIYYDNTEEDKTARFRDFIDDINVILNKCNMAGIYPVNPYEAFILMCLVTNDPLGAFYDVWRLSYGKEL